VGGAADQAGGRPSVLSVAGTLAVMLAVTSVYVWAPLDSISLDRRGLVVLTFVIGLLGTGSLVFSQALGYRRTVDSGTAKLRGLLVALYIAVLFFAAAFYLLAHAQPEEFTGLSTRLDAVYFALTVLSTVGFGDIHAVGQAARAMVCAQIVFDLLVVSLAVGAVREAGRARPRP
jgi:voltage-gated potassium channel